MNDAANTSTAEESINEALDATINTAFNDTINNDAINEALDATISVTIVTTFNDKNNHAIHNSTLPLANASIAAPIDDEILIGTTAQPTTSLAPSFSPTPTAAPSIIPTYVPTLKPTWPPPPPASETNTSIGLIESTDTTVLRSTIQVYGTLYMILLMLFCFCRRRYNKYFNIRSWVKELECDLAKKSDYGLISWMWKVFQVDEDDILEQCGMDALCFIRVLRIGRKLALVGCFQACWLIPVYATAEDSAETYYLEDKLVLISTAHLPSESPRFLATVICAYIIFIYAMALIKRELQWYTSKRHKFLSQRRPRNYAVYVSGIPEELRSGAQLAEFFRQAGATSSVLEAHVTLACPELESLVAQRGSVRKQLARAEEFERIHGRRKTKTSLNLRRLSGGTKRGISRSSGSNKLVETIDSVEVLERILRHLTKDIALAYQNIERANDPYSLEQHRDMVMQEIEETRQAERAQNIANRERVNSYHDLDMVEEICHVEEEVDNEEKVPVNDQFLKVAEAFFFGDLSPQSAGHQEQQQLLRDRVEEDKKENDLRVTIHSCDNQVHYLNSTEILSAEDQDDSEKEKKEDGRPSLFHSSRPRPVHNAFPSKSTISTIPGTFDNQTSTKWAHTNSLADSQESANPKQHYPTKEEVVSIYQMAEAASVCSSDSESSEDSDYHRVREAIRRKKDKDSSESSRSWSTNATSVIRRVSQEVRNLGGGVGKTVVGVGSEVGKATKQSLKAAGGLGIAAGDLSISNIKRVGELGVRNVQNVAGNVNKLGVDNIKTIRESAAAVVPVVMGHKEGKALEGGFVVFKDLYSKHAALQMLHYKEAGVMQVEEAPGPAEMFWRNVGLPGNAKRTGRLLTLTATVVLCLFWTVPVSFIAALTEVNSLKENVPALAEAVENHPSLERALALIAPLLLLILQDVLLPEFLSYFTAWEGHISSSTLESAVFVKYATFVLVQTFFISAISGSISAELTNMLNEPDQFVDFLANALPAQSNYFLQILVVALAVTMGLEMLRVAPLGYAFLRTYVGIGPNLTEEERKKRWKFLTPLEDPKQFEHANISGSVVLYFMVFFVYCCLAPVSCFFLLIMFFLMESGYRYNFYHNYPPTPDSGGKHWKGFFHIILGCMIVAQLTLVGFLVLKRSLYAIPFMVPLIVISVLFILYLNNYQLHAADHLPTSECVRVDKANRLKDYNFVKNKYVQPCILEAQSDEIFEII